MDFKLINLISGKHILLQVLTIVGGLIFVIGIWAGILYIQAKPHYKFYSEEYLNLIQRIETVMEEYKTKIDNISSGSDSINQKQADAMGNLFKSYKDSLIRFDVGHNGSTITLKYTDFTRYYNKHMQDDKKVPVYDVITAASPYLSTEQKFSLQRMEDSSYKSVADISQSIFRIVPYLDKTIQPLTKQFIVYVDKKTGMGQLALWFLIPGLILFSIGLSIWITRVKREKREEKRFASIKKFEESDKKEIRPAWVMAQETLKEYFDRNLFQIRLIFVVSVFIMAVGFILIAVGVMIAYNEPGMSLMQNVSVAAGLITELIGATFIVIYNSTIRQAIKYTDSLERINSVGMSVTILDSMKDSIADKDALNQAKIDVAKLLLTLDKKTANAESQV